MPKSKRAESRSKGKRGELDFVHFCKERGSPRGEPSSFAELKAPAT